MTVLEYSDNDGNTIEIEPNSNWVNYGDMNPEIHGGRFVQWDNSQEMWHLVTTMDLEEMGLDGMIQNGEKWLIEDHWIEPMDLFENGNPENGPTDDFKSIIESLSRVSGYENALVDHNIEWFVADFDHYIHGRDSYTDNYWSYLEETYGIDKDEF